MLTEYRGRAIRTPDLYLGAPGLKLRSWDQLSWQIFMAVLTYSREMSKRQSLLCVWPYCFLCLHFNFFIPWKVLSWWLV